MKTKGFETSERLFIPRVADIEDAERRIAPYIHGTPIFTSRTIDTLLGVQLYFKAENLQKVGAFKFRGASNAVFSLTDGDAERGVVTHSSGNHAQALALAARERGVPAYIVMPENAPLVKVAAVKAYGGTVTFCESTLEARERTSAGIEKEKGACFIHPYNDGRVIAGQATAAKELLSQVPDLDCIIAPVGGGGLLSGTALSAQYFSPRGTAVQVFGAEPAKADDAARSFASKTLIPIDHPDTIADGLRTSLSPLTLSIILNGVSDILTVSEESIIQAMRFLWERMKLVVEPSGCVPLGALWEYSKNTAAFAGRFKGKRIGIILSGGNADMNRLPFADS